MLIVNRVTGRNCFEDKESLWQPDVRFILNPAPDKAKKVSRA